MAWEEQSDSRKLPDLTPKGWKYLEDDDVMPFGKHAGVKMKDVPADYLMWLYKEGCRNKGVLNYISRNYDRLKAAAGEKTKK